MTSTANVFKEAAGRSIGWSVVMILLGFVAMLMPLLTGIGVSIFAGWLIVFSGVAYIAHAFAARGAGIFIWRLLIGVIYVVGGIYLAFNPGLALVTLTLVLALVFFTESILEAIVFFAFRALPGSGWILFDSIVTLLLAYVIWRPWPVSSAWAIGTLFGINVIISGSTRLMYSVAVRNSFEAIA